MDVDLKNDRTYDTLDQFLKNNETAFLNLWENQIIVNVQDDSELIRENGSLMYQFIRHSLTNAFSDDELRDLATKVARERSDANINIGDFVYNVNLGRSIIIKNVIHFGSSLDELHAIVELINQLIDSFLYYAVSSYTKLKDKSIHEKNILFTQSHKDRLTILGQMSSSFVHEFRNPLTSVIGFIRLLKNDHPTLKYLDIISKELDSLKFRITQFLHTSKVSSINETVYEIFSIKELLDEVLDFLYPSLVDWNIAVTTQLSDQVKIKGDRNELKQVLQNLLMNAIDAVSEIGKDREIRILSEIINEEVVLTFSNNGPVIDPDAIPLLFEPFYTTKKLGTGIGLFVCRNIIENNNGSITCLPQQNLTVFQVKLPIIEETSIV